ncbi:MAG: Sua5/YciO/YrdC/YwlC family protein, partial [Desulfitobacteriaceae bacterium]|nr:Sua5/YciO/YrdC/YwlC family protein [Desulfitobacteriaceae bacterium]
MPCRNNEGLEPWATWLVEKVREKKHMDKRVFLKDTKGKIIAQDEAVWPLVKEALHLGKVIAVKGLGGYHLCCDALNAEAAATLRSRKVRWDKPFAVMMPDLETVNIFCRLDEDE